MPRAEQPAGRGSSSLPGTPTTEASRLLSSVESRGEPRGMVDARGSSGLRRRPPLDCWKASARPASRKLPHERDAAGGEVARARLGDRDRDTALHEKMRQTTATALDDVRSFALELVETSDEQRLDGRRHGEHGEVARRQSQLKLRQHDELVVDKHSARSSRTNSGLPSARPSKRVAERRAATSARPSSELISSTGLVHSERLEQRACVAWPAATTAGRADRAATARVAQDEQQGAQRVQTARYSMKVEEALPRRDACRRGRRSAAGTARKCFEELAEAPRTSPPAARRDHVMPSAEPAARG